MKLDLSRIDAQGLGIELSASEAPPEARQEVRIRAAQGLRGKFEQTTAQLRLDDVEATHLTLEALRLMFGAVVIAAAGETQMHEVSTSFVRSASGVEMDLEFERLDAPQFRVEVADIQVGANTRLDEPHLTLRPGQGQVRARKAEFTTFSLSLGATRVTAKQLDVSPLTIGWGDAGFSLCAANVLATQVVVRSGGAEVTLEKVRANELVVRGGAISVSGLTARGIATQLTLDGKKDESLASPDALAPRSDPDAKPARLPWINWELLDHLSGQVHVDVGVDVSVPVIRRRKAVHRLRISVNQGRLDFRALESDLSRLEDALFDFAVRDDALVLELGIPLLPTRGLGKPLLRWPLEPAELELAQSQRLVRLATLARPEIRNKSVAPEAPDKSRSSRPPSVMLRALEFRSVEARLALAKNSERHAAMVRHLAFDTLHLSGDAIHNPADLEELKQNTELVATLQNLHLVLEPLALGDRLLTLSALDLTDRTTVKLALSELKPVAAMITMEGLHLPRLEFAPRP